MKKPKPIILVGLILITIILLIRTLIQSHQIGIEIEQNKLLLNGKVK